MPSQEMLQKLLEEFDEKEAQNREEINIVNLRIEELEKRIGGSKSRLDKIGMDRKKISEMMNRYSGDNLRKGTFVPANFTPKPVELAPSSAPSALHTPLPSPAAVEPPPSPPPLARAAAAPPPASSPAAVPAPSPAPASAAPATPATPVVSTFASSASADAASAPAPAIEPWGIVKTAPATPIVFDTASASAPLPFSVQSAAPQPFGSSAASPSISGPLSSASAPAPGAPSASGSPFGAGASPAEASVEPFSTAAPASSSSDPFAPLASAAPAPTPTPNPLSSLNNASLFSTPPGVTATGENAAFSLDSASSSSPFASTAPSAPQHTTPLSTPPGGLSAALMGSMPIGGGSTPPASSGGAGKFDMMDLFAPLAGEGDEGSDEPVSEPAADVAEHALAENQFYSSPNSAAAPTGAQPADPAAAATDEPDMSTATQDHPSLDLGEDTSAQSSEEEGDDTVKSINDALRGLFR